MIAKHRLRPIALALVAAASVVACGSHEWLELNPEVDVKAPTFRLTGEVHYVDVEGGIFTIQSTDGTTYNPVNLPDSYKVDKMAVEADARVRTDLVSPAMVGPLVELLRIRATGH
ncbi:MAG TPA: hypothetical protein VN852_13570 [Candidatus Krumholzibacteria bacterium]|nr:hypothetical protein [Candidatus Krumholzibacteria bacterium]